MKSTKKQPSAAVIAWGTVLVLIAIILFVLLSAFIFQALVWNIGVVGLAAACGLAVAHISFHTAIGAVFLVNLLRSIFSPARPTKPNTDKAIGYTR